LTWTSAWTWTNTVDDPSSEAALGFWPRSGDAGQPSTRTVHVHANVHVNVEVNVNVNVNVKREREERSSRDC
jgi:hypothetical protein